MKPAFNVVVCVQNSGAAKDCARKLKRDNSYNMKVTLSLQVLLVASILRGDETRGL